MLVGYWFPLTERAFLICLFGVGATFGSVLSFALSGVFCQELGWPWVFYVYSKIVANICETETERKVNFPVDLFNPM